MTQINNDEMILNIVYYNDYDETEKLFDMFIINPNELNKILLCDNNNELTETINNLTGLIQTIYNVDLIYCHNGHTIIKNLYNQKYHDV